MTSSETKDEGKKMFIRRYSFLLVKLLEEIIRQKFVEKQIFIFVLHVNPYTRNREIPLTNGV